ncbi:ribose-phosphate diphosphokinase [Vagococcus silagei]|uniref:Ribose-phosphate pyrophosphokinase n=1 Tax=Vagococcus silagei TaxID=2508885 RepID=A0A4S3B3K3_9ENTE|nr:ribose-phosphate diphosphokinase [Vagococcus silagei]THB60340.1 ribose-phosphate diphosphokinase [Vagococcus silagei]
MNNKKLKLISLNGNIPLAEKIADLLEMDLCKCSIQQFSDGEIAISIEESIRGADVFIIQSTNHRANDYYMELIIMIDALKRASAKSINVVLPYYGYSKSDHTRKPHNPITAKVIANMIADAGATRVLTFDLHNAQVQGFFDIPSDNLFAVPLFAKYFQDTGKCGEDFVIVAPKSSGIKRARSLSEYLDTTLAIVDKGENHPYIIGNVKGKNCIILDDMITTGNTFLEVSELLKENGANDIFGCASHGLFVEGAKEKLEKSPIQDICVTDSCLVAEDRVADNVTYISCSELLTEAIRGIYLEKSLSKLFQLEGLDEIIDFDR